MCVTDSVLYWTAKSFDVEILVNVTNVTFCVYGVSLSVCLGFLIVAIFRIKRLLKEHTTVKLNESHVGMHTSFLIINVVLNFLFLTTFVLHLHHAPIQILLSLLYFSF